MTIRRTAQWQWSLDDRILEHLRDESFSTAARMADLPNIHATEAQVQERCEVLADADLVTFATIDMDFVELTTWGKQYLEGELDVEDHPKPRHPIFN
ncbi:hypothetical protein SAMN05216226_10691 [Halovenus aranensis]|uniref:Winged helix-turn-helix domain-containing protein n=1 Tax=Halovenus aranensis TaxID=890420 RepID=A0A1G8V9X8_9EURY|nr:hypothetical protein SAMN05216226_10691 [Halovenus aranensis]